MTNNFLAGISRYGQVFLQTSVDSTVEPQYALDEKTDKKLMKENDQDYNEENFQFSDQGNVVM